jgi:hypothetical protein
VAPGPRNTFIQLGSPPPDVIRATTVSVSRTIIPGRLRRPASQPVREGQAAALLIAAKRADQVASEIAVHTETNTDDIKVLLQQNTDLTQAVEALTQAVHDKVVGAS